MGNAVERYTSFSRLRSKLSDSKLSQGKKLSTATVVKSENRKFVVKAESSNPYKISSSWYDFCCERIVRSGKNFVNFIPYAYQVKLMELYDKHYGLCVLKSRQLGLSECFVAKFAQNALLDPASYHLFFSRKQADTSLIASRTRQLLSSVPGIDYDRDTSTIIIPTGGGVIQFETSTENSGRSVPSVSAILYDEAGFIESLDELYSASMATMSMSGADAKVVMVSTRGDDEGHYWDTLSQYNGDLDLDATIKAVASGELYSDGLPGFYYWVDQEGWAKVLIHWSAHPIYGADPDFMANTKRRMKLSDRGMDREYGLGAKSISKMGLVDAAAMLACVKDFEAYVPDDNRWRVIAIDPNSGGGDFFSASVWESFGTAIYKVDTYHEQNERMSASLNAVKKLCKKWKPNSGIIESNIESKFREDMDIEIPSILWEKFVTNTANKAGAIESLCFEMEECNVRFSASDILNTEAPKFDRVKLKASSGHDDTVIEAALAVLMHNTVKIRDGATGNFEMDSKDHHSSF
jgi:hypothetical protein